jgi:hypothetical protein
LPETVGWERRPHDNPQGDRLLRDGWFVQTVRLPDGWPGPTGEFDFYRMPLTAFVGVDRFFVEWRAITDNPTWLLDLFQVPAVVSASGNSSTYHTTMTDGMIRVLGRGFVPFTAIDVEPGVAHFYRVEIDGTKSFTWFVDGQVVESGIPHAAYPDPTAFLIWGVGREYVDATTAWDYIRFGVIPEEASGDFDSDGAVTLFDFYFFHDCLTKDGPGIYGGPNRDAGPGCRFADFDGNQSVDLLDFAEFQNMFDSSHP